MMKNSLKQAFILFSIRDRVILCFNIILAKLHLPNNKDLLYKCNEYVKLIELGVSFENYSLKYLKAKFLINNIDTAFFIRKNGSDIKVFSSVIVGEEYSIVIKKLSGKKVEAIVDAGGNIGMTSIYFKCFFPLAKVYIIEPDDHNFTILKRNVEANNLTDIVFFKNALWTSNENLVINNDFRDGEEWSLTVGTPDKLSHPKTRGSHLEGITLETLCKSEKINKIDLFKVDIEGAERFLYDDNNFIEQLASKVDTMVIEIHDEFDIRSKIYEKMDKIGFTRDDQEFVTVFQKKYT